LRLKLQIPAIVNTSSGWTPSPFLTGKGIDARKSVKEVQIVLFDVCGHAPSPAHAGRKRCILWGDDWREFEDGRFTI
jgi:hypothetical protein